MRVYILNNFYITAMGAILMALIPLGCGNPPPTGQPYANPINTFNLTSNQAGGCNGSLFPINSKPGYIGSDYDAVGKYQYNVCVARNQTTGTVQFTITAVATGGLIVVYPMHQAADGSLALIDNPQNFQLSINVPSAQASFSTPQVNYLIIVDAQFANLMYNPYDPYGSCLSGYTVTCPTYAEGPIQ